MSTNEEHGVVRLVGRLTNREEIQGKDQVYYRLFLTPDATKKNPDPAPYEIACFGDMACWAAGLTEADVREKVKLTCFLKVRTNRAKNGRTYNNLALSLLGWAKPGAQPDYAKPRSGFGAKPRSGFDQAPQAGDTPPESAYEGDAEGADDIPF